MGEIIQFDQERIHKAHEWIRIQNEAYSLAVLQVPEQFEFQQGVFAVGNTSVDVFTEVEARYLRRLPMFEEEEYPVLEGARIIPVPPQRSKFEYPAVSMVLDIPTSDVVNTKKVKIEQVSRAYVATMWPNGTMRFRTQLRSTNMYTRNRKVHRTQEVGPILSPYSINPESVDQALRRLFTSRV